MDQEKAEFGRWWIWVLVLTVGSLIVLGGLNYVGVIGRTVVQRKVFEESFQYSEAVKAEIATYEAQLAEIDARLAVEISDNERSQLTAQRSAIAVRLTAARGKR